VGTAIGLELRDTTQALSATNTKPVKAGMAFNVAIGEWWWWWFVSVSLPLAALLPSPVS
jgi:hypothetical protein